MNWNNPEERRKYMHRWYEANKERIQQQYNTPRGRAKMMAKYLKQTDEKAERGECTLTADWILKNIFTSKCHYCGESDWRKLGCDRINNALPHTSENVVCSCWDCNHKRSNMPFDKFVAKCKEAGEIVTNRNDPKKSKSVVALDEDGNVVYEFPSLMEAGRNGYDPSAVRKCCNGCYMRDGNHQYKGLWWYWA